MRQTSDGCEAEAEEDIYVHINIRNVAPRRQCTSSYAILETIIGLDPTSYQRLRQEGPRYTVVVGLYVPIKDGVFHGQYRPGRVCRPNLARYENRVALGTSVLVTNSN